MFHTGFYDCFDFFKKGGKGGITKATIINEISRSSHGIFETLKQSTHTKPNKVICTKNT